MPTLDQSTLERIMAKIDRSGDCWIWTGAITGKGYGNVGISGRNYCAHRIVFEHFSGPIPEGLQLDHLCRNRSCVNPEHLEPVTNQENTLRGALSGLQTHCKRGHEWTEENTLRGSGGSARASRRRCRECARLRSKAVNERRRTQGSCEACGCAITKFATRCRSCAATLRNENRKCKP